MSKLTEELNQLSTGSLDMAKEIGRINKKENFNDDDLEAIHIANDLIRQTRWVLKNVSHET